MALEALAPLLTQIILYFAAFLIVTLSLNLEVGYAGIAQFGRVLAVLTGAVVAGAIPGRILAYMMGMPYGAEYANHLINFKIVNTITNELLTPNPLLSIGMFIFTLALAALLGGIVGFICSYPALRLKEAYLGITLLAFGDALQAFIWNYDPIAGATQGINIPDFYRWVGAGAPRFYAATITMLGIAILVYILIDAIGRAPYGRALKAMRDSEVAAAVYGKDIAGLRGRTLIVGGAIAAIGGALWTMYSLSFKAITFNRLTWTFWPWAFMMLGGTGNNFGVLIGTFIFSTARTLIFTYKELLTQVIPISPQWLEYILVGTAIVVIALLRPQGIIPEKPALTLKREEIIEIKERVRSRSK